MRTGANVTSHPGGEKLHCRAGRQRVTIALLLDVGHRAVPVIVLSALDDRQTVLAAIAAGAAGYIPKSSSNDVMREAVRLVLAGGKYLPPAVLAGTVVWSALQRKAIADAPTLGLTDRQ